MTIKEIAELCGVEPRTINYWVHKIADDPGKNFQGINEKLTKGLGIAALCGVAEGGETDSHPWGHSEDALPL
jgi:hypothetical protein